MCHHCHIHNVFHFRSVHHLAFQVFFLFTNIYNLSVFLLSHFLGLSLRPLSLQPHSPSLFKHVHYPPLFLSRSLFSLAHHFTLFCCGRHLALSLSLSLSLSVSLSLPIFYAHPTNNDMSYTFDYTVQHISKISQNQLN